MPRTRLSSTASEVRSASESRCARRSARTGWEGSAASPSQLSHPCELRIQADPTTGPGHVVEVDELADVLLEGLFGNRDAGTPRNVSPGDVSEAAQFLMDHLTAVTRGDVE